MLLWMVFGVGDAAETIVTAASDSEKADAAIGTGLRAMMIMFVWIAGDVVLGLMTLLTRPKK
jgi:hypothetical protein